MNEYINDIPLSTAINAHNGTSHDPERRGESERNGYAETLTKDLEMLSGYTDTEEKKALLENEFARYREGYKAHTLKYLQSRNGLMSSFIAGPANFPVARMEKRHNSVEKRLNELIEYRTRALEAIKKTLRPELRPVMAGDADAVERLQDKIAKAEAEQAQMKAINAAHKAFLKNPASLDKSDLPEQVKTTIRNYKPAYSWEPHPIAPFQLTNLNANITRMKERLGSISKAKAESGKTEERENARLEDAPAENRVRLFFPGKPDETVRGKLKTSGFRWTPSMGCWQAYRNYRSLNIAAEIAGSEVLTA